MIILTDFLCWIPFTVLCILHYEEVIDGEPLYPYSSILILPINSLLNPLLYSPIISDKLYTAVAIALAYIFKINSGENIIEPEIEIPSDLRYNEDGTKNYE